MRWKTGGIPLHFWFAAAVMIKLLLPSKILIHLSAGRFAGCSIKHPDAVLQAEHVDIVNDSVSTAALDATSAEMIARTEAEKCILKRLYSVEDLV
jgi:hypothetical protein